MNNPLPTLAAVIGALVESEKSELLSEAGKVSVTNAILFLAERLAAMTMMIDPAAPSVKVFQAPRGNRRSRAGDVLLDVAKGMARRVRLTKLVNLDADVRPYLAGLMVAALHRAGETLIYPDTMKSKEVTEE